MKRWIAWFMAAVMLPVLAGCGDSAGSSFVRPAISGFDAKTIIGDVTMDVLSVGKADAIIITTANHVIVVDTGEDDDGGKVCETILNMGRSVVDLLVITHFDKDHIGGAKRLIETLEVKRIVQPNYAGVREEYDAYVTAANAAQLTREMLTADLNLVFDDLQININPPARTDYGAGDSNDNCMSLMLSMWHGDNSILLTGDAEKQRLSEIISRGGIKTDFLKVPHHGVQDPLMASFLTQAAPKYAAVCDSEKNPADPAVADKLAELGVAAYYTRNGTITVVSNGKGLTVTQK